MEVAAARAAIGGYVFGANGGSVDCLLVHHAVDLVPRHADFHCRLLELQKGKKKFNQVHVMLYKLKDVTPWTIGLIQDQRRRLLSYKLTK